MTERFPLLEYNVTRRFNKVTHSQGCDYEPYKETLEYQEKQAVKRTKAAKKAKRDKFKKMKKEKEDKRR